jgi:hypothetical protein
MLGYARLMYFILRGLIMDGHNSLNFTSVTTISLLIYSLHLDSDFTAGHILTRMDTSSIGL